MASNHATLDAAATERKTRLAKLKNLKRKQASTDLESSENDAAVSRVPERFPPVGDEISTKYLSGRNYDSETRGPKLGFENAPNAESETLEDRAAVIALETRDKEEKEDKDEKPIDLFHLQPKKPNWDLKRDVARKMEILNVRTENAIARLVRERLEGQKTQDLEQKNGHGGGVDGESTFIGGAELVEGMHVREREEEESERRERQRDEDEDIS